jgi:hypothetical protein
MLHAVVARVAAEIGVGSSGERSADEDADVAALLEAGAAAERLARRVAAALAGAAELDGERLARLLQLAVDVCASESVDGDEKKPVLLALDALRRVRPLHLPDPTPISTTHLQEWTKTQK